MAEVSMCQIPPRLESMPRLNSDVKINDAGYNVMVVKWVNGSNVKDYSKAAANTRSVGTAVANVLDKLIAAKKIVLEKTTLMGFSLGAHISGYVGSLFNGTMPRIFGRQHLVTITSPSGAKGSIRLRLYDQRFGWSNQSKFQRFVIVRLQS
uniref:Lipase domain-containing protein n=1 Tax=Romanomermis culicivorax TaxID=13658 RepID=A0A915I231_ROMCU